jgi:hypothetical protein
VEEFFASIIRAVREEDSPDVGIKTAGVGSPNVKRKGELQLQILLTPLGQTFSIRLIP